LTEDRQGDAVTKTRTLMVLAAVTGLFILVAFAVQVAMTRR
jgi:hypothetical protein